MRSKRRDKLSARFKSFALQNFEPFWRLVQSVPFLERLVNAAIINTACNAATPRPHPMSALSDYTSWRSLTDKSYLALSVPPEPQPDDLPSVADATALFMPQGEQRKCRKSTLLFPVFAQYLTDGFLRTVSDDPRKTTSNHDIDLSPLYGRTYAQTCALRLRSGELGRRGRLQSQMIEGEEFPPFLHTEDGSAIHPDFLDEDGAPVLDLPLGMGKDWTDQDRARRRLFAVGGDRANSTALISMINTLFLREHNRLAGEIENRHPSWGDDQVFETARNVVIPIFIKIVVEEYINHISSACFKLKADPKAAWHAKWNKPNWMSVEFSLLYRWHSLVPETMRWGSKPDDAASGPEIGSHELLLDNARLLGAGLGNAFAWVSETHAGKLDLHNTPAFLEAPEMWVESKAIEQNRKRRLASYNQYRLSMGMETADGFDCITGDPARQKELSDLYRSPDRLDFYVGLFAEDEGANTPMPPLMGAMVALDAFSQALNNPLLSEQVFNEATLTEYGMGEFERTASLWDILDRNRGEKWPGIGREDIGMTRKDWRRRFVGF